MRSFIFRVFTLYTGSYRRFRTTYRSDRQGNVIVLVVTGAEDGAKSKGAGIDGGGGSVVG
jgi:hypothetical protein